MHYGFDIGRGNRIACPFHSGKDKNLGFKDDFYHCFVCGTSGDLIKFVREFFGLSFSEAVQKLNSDFGLGLPIGEKLGKRQQLELSRKSFEVKKKRERAEKERRTIEGAFWEAFDEFVRLDAQMVKYKPKCGERTLHPLYVDALKNIEYAKYALGCAQEELIKFEYRSTNSDTGIHGG